jgi:hypothetical protein
MSSAVQKTTMRRKGVRKEIIYSWNTSPSGRNEIQQ